MKTITDGNFQEKLLGSNEKLLLVDCSAEWCSPCKKLKPILEQLAVEHADQVDINILDIEENPETVKKFQIRGVPSLLWFKNGILVQTTVGLLSKQSLVKEIADLSK